MNKFIVAVWECYSNFIFLPSDFEFPIIYQNFWIFCCIFYVMVLQKIVMELNILQNTVISNVLNLVLGCIQNRCV